jgi:L-xylulose reductase
VGVVDGLVNNAGIAILEPFLETKIENYEKVMKINVRSVLLISQGVARNMTTQNIQGSIVNVSSQASSRGFNEHTSYCTSKGALDQLTRMMAVELGPLGIRVNSVNPTVVLTDMGKMAWNDPIKSGPMLSRIPQARFANPLDVSESIMFLLSEQSNMINGVMLPVDGGFLCT